MSVDLDEAFGEFHRANPHVLELLVRLCREAQARGVRRLSAKALIERARWDLGVATDGEPYRLNNSHTSRYARLIADRHPELAALFEFRSLRAPPPELCSSRAPFSTRQCRLPVGHAGRHETGRNLDVELWGGPDEPGRAA